MAANQAPAPHVLVQQRGGVQPGLRAAEDRCGGQDREQRGPGPSLPPRHAEDDPATARMTRMRAVPGATGRSDGICKPASTPA